MFIRSKFYGRSKQQALLRLSNSPLGWSRSFLQWEQFLSGGACNFAKVMTKVEITKSMLDALEYDTKNMSSVKAIDLTTAGKPLVTPTVMIAFADSDLNAAAYHLAKSLENPFAANAVATVLVQEAAQDDFTSILKTKLTYNYPENIKEHQGFANALKNIQQLKARTVAGATQATAPTVVCDITHEHLGQTGATGVVTLHTFRTAKEAIALQAKESLNFANASIWNVNHACAYELVAALRCANFYINCHQVPLDPIKSQLAEGKSAATMDKSHHYEVLVDNDCVKGVVFPVGTIFAN